MINKNKKFDFTVIGAGPMGLYLSYLLSNVGFKIRLIDGNNHAGGHAKPINFCGCKIEIFYHFFYKNDEKKALRWVNGVSGDNRILWKKIDTDIVYKHKNNKYFINPDNIAEIFKLLKLEFIQLIFGFMKLKLFNNNYNLKFKKAHVWAKMNFGKKFSLLVWLPLLKGKFGKYWDKISALWLSSRIKTHLSTKNFTDRKSLFGYLCNTYQPTINKTLKHLKKRNSIFIPNAMINNITIKKNRIIKLKLKNKNLNINKNEKIISTIPLFALKKIFKNKKEFKYLKKFEGISVIVCIMKIKKKLSNAYWTSVSDHTSPFNAVIQQNRLYPKSNFEIVYTSKYVESDSIFFKKNKKSIVEETVNSILEIYPHISKSDIQKISVFKSLSAAPIPTINTISKIPNFKSPIENFWHGGLEYIYPEDRGLGNSIEISEKLFNEVKQLYVKATRKHL